jgi:hypothetical protein
LALIEDVGAGPVGLDTAIFIYFIEEHERFLPVIAHFLRRRTRANLST